MTAARRACPCGSKRVHRKCCRPLHQGQPAPSAEALMRSRYAAYALGRAEYIVQTTHPEGPHWEENRIEWVQRVRDFCASTEFLGLEVLDTSTNEEPAWVWFHAHLRQEGRDASFSEKSAFRKVEGRWLYVEALPQPGGTPPP